MSMSDSGVWIVYLCRNCDDWHSRFLGFLDEGCSMAEVVRTIGRGFVANEAATDYGLLALYRTDRHSDGLGDLVTLFQAGAVTRATHHANVMASIVSLALDTASGLEGILDAASTLGEQTAHTEDDWAAILKALVTGSSPAVDEIAPMTRETFTRLMGG